MAPGLPCYLNRPKILLLLPHSHTVPGYINWTCTPEQANCKRHSPWEGTILTGETGLHVHIKRNSRGILFPSAHKHTSEIILNFNDEKLILNLKDW